MSLTHIAASKRDAAMHFVTPHTAVPPDLTSAFTDKKQGVEVCITGICYGCRGAAEMKENLKDTLCTFQSFQ